MVAFDSGSGVAILLVALSAALACGCDRAVPPQLEPAPPRATASASASVSLPAAVDAAVAAADAAVDASIDAAPAPPARRPGAYANVDPSDDGVVGPPDELPGCEEALTAAGITYRKARLPIQTDRATKLVCGAPQAVTYLKGPGKIAYDPTPLLTCGMALALGSFERIVQEEATRAYGSPVVRIEQQGTYACRGIAAFKGMVSEHSYANAIDLTRFTLKNGKSITVVSDFKPDVDPPARAGAFLRAISRRAFDEEVFSVVLGPFFNAQHANHFHVDLARYRTNGTR